MFCLFFLQFTGVVEQLVLNDGQISELEELFSNQPYSDYYVVFLRCVDKIYGRSNMIR